MAIPRRREVAARPQGRGLLRRFRRLALVLLLVFCVVPPAVLLAYRVVPPLVTPLMLIRLLQGETLDYRWRPSAELSPHLARAAIASEDNLFCEHWGLDVQALRTEIERALAGQRPRGASTITQQTAKNLFLWPGRDPVRKVLEAWLAPQLELILGKRRIMELYLNVVEFGPGIYGAEAAAQHWFGKAAKNLSQAEAARLTVILPAPRSWRPDGDWARRRGQVIQRRIGQLGPLLDCVD